jgi:hypothetical protein
MHKPQANILELIPEMTLKEYSEDDGKITLFLPKFRNDLLRKWLIPRRKSDVFRIHLDASGSRVWKLIDGKRTTGEICDLLALSGNMQAEEAGLSPEQVTDFIRQLYKNRFIMFKS